jgi:predicted DNA-binding WGR domain protein
MKVRFENSIGIELVGDTIHRHWGRIGTAGQRNQETYPTLMEADQAYRDEVWRRRERGYSVVHDEEKPHDAQLAKAQQRTQALTASEPLSESPRYMFVNSRTQQFMWLEQHGSDMRFAGGKLHQLAKCVAQTISHPTARNAENALQKKMGELLSTGYTLNAFDAVAKTTAKKRSVKKVTVATAAATTPATTERWAFFGEFEQWPSYHAAMPQEIARRRGVTIVETLDETVVCVVFGQGRGSGKTKAIRDVERLQKGGSNIRVLDEAMFRELVQIDLTGKRFHFVGGFDCAPGDAAFVLVSNMVTSRGGLVVAPAIAELDYLVSGNRTGPEKIKTENAVKAFIAKGASTKLLSESDFLQLVRQGDSATTIDFSGFVAEIHAVCDERKVARAMKMLQTERCSLYANMQDTHLLGVVRSQTSADTVYASWLTHDGNYGCVKSDQTACMGQAGGVCKHLLVLTIGLVRTQQLEAKRAINWLRAAGGKSAQMDQTLTAHAFVQYAGALAGEIDWRPTETIPEDYYAM